MDKAEILAEIVRTAEKNGGKPLGRERFESATGIVQNDWLGKHWTKWSDAQIEAEFEPNKMNPATPIDQVYEKLCSFISKLERFPTKPELQMKARNEKGFPWPTQLDNRIAKRKAERAQKLIEWCQSNGKYLDVIEICKPIAATAKADDTTLDSATDDRVDGFVYLMKLKANRRHYKIGRSNCPEYRRLQFETGSPEKVELIHKIATDDPSGIEKYWHRRFKDKKIKGKEEQFLLTADDVRAFKRRKRFM